MKNVLLIIICLFLSGCSLLPKLNFNTDGTTPQSINKSKVKEKCKGKLEFYVDGRVKSCSKGYYNYEEGYNKQERKFTIKEKIINFFRNLNGSLFWIAIALVILCPSLLGMIFGRILEGATGIASQTLKSVTKAVQKARKNGTDLNTALDTELDKKDKEYIKKIKAKENIK